MSLFKPKDWRNCATCQFWTGTRHTDDRHVGVRAGPIDCGSCRLAKYKGQRRFATNACIQWQQWNVLVSA